MNKKSNPILEKEYSSVILNMALSRDDYNKALEYASMANEPKLVKYLLTSPEIDYNPYINLAGGAALHWACNFGNLDLVKFLLTSPTVLENASININNGIALRNACGVGSLELVQYLLTSPELKEHADIEMGSNFGTAFPFACSSGNLDLVKYLLTSPDLKTHSNPHLFIKETNDYSSDIEEPVSSLLFAALKGHTHIIDYLVSSPELKKNVDIHEGEDFLFKKLYEHSKYDVIEYLVFNKKLDYTENIKEFLKENPDKIVHSIFTIKMLDKELSNKVESEANSKKPKI